jgi:EpsI family protein
MYYSAFAWLIDKDWPREDYNYAYIIPLVACYLFWEKRDEFRAVTSSPTWVGYIAIFFGLVFFWLGELSGELFSQYFSFWLIVVGILWAIWGWAKLKTVGFGVFILLAMFPPPHFLHNQLTFKLKLISTQIGVWMLQAYGMSAYREGNVIDLGFTQLQVVDACSGLRYLYPLIIMAILLAYFYRGGLWKKALLVASAVPLTIFTNSFRIAATGVLYEIWGPAVAEDFFHGFSGWFIFMFGLAVLLLEMWALNGFRGLGLLGGLGGLKDPKSKAIPIEGDLAPAPGCACQPLQASGCCSTATPEASAAAGDASSAALLEPAEAAAKEGALQGFDAAPCPSNLKPETLNLKPAAGGWSPLLHPPQFIVAVALLAATLAAAQGIEFREKIPPAKDFASFPLEVGEWTGRRDAMEEKFIKELDLSDYVIVDYQNSGKAVNFYTAYYETQRKGESIHSPETCLPGGGWEFKNAGVVTVPLSAPAGSSGQRANGPTITVNRAFMEKGATKQLSYFWFPSRDRVLKNAWEMKWYNFWDALTRQRTDGALVRLITPVYPNEGVEEADRRLAEFTQAIVPVLNEYLPK